MNSATKDKLNSILILSIVSLSNISCANDTGATDTINASIPTPKTASIDDHISKSINSGEKAHKNHCYKCHTDDIYTRDNRIVKSIDALSQQVVRCKNGSGIPWFDEDADAVVQFLNNKYYKF